MGLASLGWGSSGRLGFILRLEYDWRLVRKRLQIELGPAEQVAFERIRGLGSNDAEIGRRALTLLARLPDVAPELTNAVAPERR